MTDVTRELDIFTLKNAAAEWAKDFQSGSVTHPVFKDRWISGRSHVMSQLYKVDYLDEFEGIVAEMNRVMEEPFRHQWEIAKRKQFTPRDPALHEEILARKLAIFPDGQHIPGKIGTVQRGNRMVGRSERKITLRETLPRTGILERFGLRNPKSVIISETIRFKNDYWPVYAGEQTEREMESGVADDLPAGAEHWPLTILMATNPKMSNVAAIGACNFIVDDLDKGASAATIRGRTGSQPADVDATEDGTLLFTLTMSSTAFDPASDDTGKASASASTITQDASADATGTLGWCRMGATGAGGDDTMDGEAGTSASDFNFNTLSIVSGSTVDMTALTVSVSE